MLDCFTADTENKVISIIPICQKEFGSWLEWEEARTKNTASNNKFSAKPGSFCLIINQEGNLEKVLLGIKDKDDMFSFGALPKALPKGVYSIFPEGFSKEQLDRAAIAWGLGSYEFTRYKEKKDYVVQLLCYEARIQEVVSSIYLTRDLINTPAGDLYPERLAEIASDLAKEFKAKIKIFKDEKLKKEFPSVFAVGRASKNKPLLIDIHYGDPEYPKIVLVGKGVCFDSGGLQLKPSSAILTMKKDMAGAAHALGLLRMVMVLKLPINLRVIIPAVENLISGDELKPDDVIRTRKGLTVEVNNTDAEGRLILADALTFASESNPDLILDFATLTGAMHVALGSDIVGLFSNDDEISEKITSSMWDENEPVWRMPLYQPYLEALKGDITDFKNVPSSKKLGGGAITAALFLQQFISEDIKWAHFDMYAYNDSERPGKPKGGEAMFLRGVLNFLEKY